MSNGNLDFKLSVELFLRSFTFFDQTSFSLFSHATTKYIQNVWYFLDNKFLSLMNFMIWKWRYI